MLLERALAAAGTAEAAFVSARPVFGLGWLDHCRSTPGAWSDDLAEKLLDPSLAQSRGANTRQELVEPLLVRAKLLIRQERWKEATDELDELLETLRAAS